MLKLCRVTKVEVFFLVLVYVFDCDLFEFSAAILEKGLLYPKLIGIAAPFWKLVRGGGGGGGFTHKGSYKIYMLTLSHWT